MTSLLLFFTLAATGETAPAKVHFVPYRLSKTQHLILRARINGSRPLNFVMDTGAPAFFLSKEGAKLAGLKENENGWAVADKLEMEGGLVLEKVKTRVETPFQLKGINGMGMAGVELHGMIGYSILARFEMEIDMTKDRMKWTELDWTPPDPWGSGGRGGSAPGGLEMVGSAMAGLGTLTGGKTRLTQVPGFTGLVLAQKGEQIQVGDLLNGSTAQKSGLKVGDAIVEMEGEKPKDLAQARKKLSGIPVGKTLTLKIARNGQEMEINLGPENGF